MRDKVAEIIADKNGVEASRPLVDKIGIERGNQSRGARRTREGGGGGWRMVFLKSRNRFQDAGDFGVTAIGGDLDGLPASTGLVSAPTLGKAWSASGIPVLHVRDSQDIVLARKDNR